MGVDKGGCSVMASAAVRTVSGAGPVPVTGALGEGSSRGPGLYGEVMAASYLRGRAMAGADLQRWVAAAGPYLPDAGGRLLDLGAGTGRFTAALAESCAGPVVACEPSPAMRATCRASCPPFVPVVAALGEQLPFADGSFTTVWASQVLHHVGNLTACARALARVLVPGGFLLVRGGFGPVRQLLLHEYFPRAWRPGTAAVLPLSQITATLRAAGFVMVDRQQVAQTLAGDGAELLDKVRTRSLSPLAVLTEAEFNHGLRRLQHDVASGVVAGPFLEHLDLVAYTSSPATT